MRTLSFDRLTRLTNDTTEFLTLASTPNDEQCTQAGDNPQDQRIECEVLAGQLERIYGPIPEGAEWVIVRNDHEFGMYLELGIIYEMMAEPDANDFEQDEDCNFTTAGEMAYNLAMDQYNETPAVKYAYQCERIPDKWDNKAINELREKGHSKYQPAKVVPMHAA